MARLLIHVEGITEETFVNEVLRDHLIQVGFHSVAARLIGDPRRSRGGIVGWGTAKREMIRHLQQDASLYVTMMVDYYGLPAIGGGAWPGRLEASSVPFPEKAGTVGNALAADILAEFGDALYPNRFVPYVVMHEFEGLLFSDCTGFSKGINRLDLNSSFQAIRDQFQSPEEINDSFTTAPSKRIKQLFPGYEKPLFGTLAVLEIGLERIRSECKHFNEWLEKLEQVAKLK